ncbi:hypothetical protein ACQEU3_38780 [Spirillospora sp. CA-253888]
MRTAPLLRGRTLLGKHLLRSLAAVGLAGGTAAGVVTGPVAGPAAAEPMPAPGQVKLAAKTGQGTLVCRTSKARHQITLTGSLEVRVDSPSSGTSPKVPVTPTAARLEGTAGDIPVTATLTGPQNGELAGKSSLSFFPATHTLPLSLKFTFDGNPCATDTTASTAAGGRRPDRAPSREPLVLTTKNPAQLVGTLDRFPPTTETPYKTTAPVVLQPPSGSSTRSTAPRQAPADIPMQFETIQVGITNVQELLGDQPEGQDERQ